MTSHQIQDLWRESLIDADIPGSATTSLRGVKPVDYRDGVLYLEVPESLCNGVVEFFQRRATDLRKTLKEKLRDKGEHADYIRIHVSSVSDEEIALPDRIEGGFTLPNGTYVAHDADKKCDCIHCARAFEAYENGTLIKDGERVS